MLMNRSAHRCSSLAAATHGRQVLPEFAHTVAGLNNLSPCSVSVRGRGTAVMRQAQAPSDRACRMNTFHQRPLMALHFLKKQ